MRHSFFDKYSDLRSPLHRLDPRTKVICIAGYILTVVLTPPGELAVFAGYLAVIFAVALASRVPLAYAAKRSLAVVPFVLFTAAFVYLYGVSVPASSGGPVRGLAVIGLKSWLCVIAAVQLSSTTPFPVLLKGLERLRVPKMIILLLSFMYRYIFILADEAMSMQRARDARYFGGGYGRQVKVYGRILGSLFIRAFERGERVFKSMASRGFNGELPVLVPLRFGRGDLVFFALLAGSLAAARVFLGS